MESIIGVFWESHNSHRPRICLAPSVNPLKATFSMPPLGRHQSLPKMGMEIRHVLGSLVQAFLKTRGRIADSTDFGCESEAKMVSFFSKEWRRALIASERCWASFCRAPCMTARYYNPIITIEQFKHEPLFMMLFSLFDPIFVRTKVTVYNTQYRYTHRTPDLQTSMYDITTACIIIM